MPLQLPRLIFGATTLGNLFVAPSDAEKRELIAEWFRCRPGQVVIDTAGKYGAGLSLEVIGRELAALGVRPQDVTISNKLGWRRVPLAGPEPTFEPGAWVDLQHDAVQDISREGILRCWQEGCDLLGGYPAQLLSVHDPDEYLAAAEDTEDRYRRLQDIIGAYEALSELRDSGRATAIGVGAKDWRVIRELDALCDFDWVMFANSFTVMNHPRELVNFIDSLAGRGVTVINSALLHGGFLSGGDFFDYRKLDPDEPEDSRRLQWRDDFRRLCEEHGVSPFRVAVGFGLSHPGVRSVALSTSRADRVSELCAAVDAVLPEKLWRDMKTRGLIDQDYPHLP